MQMQVTLNTRISPELAAWLDEHSEVTKTPKAQIIAKALEEYRKTSLAGATRHRGGRRKRDESKDIF